MESFAFGGGVPEDLQTELGCVMCNLYQFCCIFLVYRGSMTVEQ